MVSMTSGDAGVGEQTSQFVPQSRIASELRGLPPRKRALLGIDNWVLDLVDAVVRTTFVLTAEDSRPLDERLDTVRAFFAPLDGAMPSVLADQIDDMPAKLEQLSAEGLPRRAKRLTRDGHWKRFAERLVGPKSYARLGVALREDSTVVAHGLRGLVRMIRPYAAAFDDLVQVLGPDQMAALRDLPGGLVASALRFVVQLDSFLEDLVASDFDWSLLSAFGSAGGDEPADLDEILEQVRPLISGTLQAQLAELNTRLVRKLRGARTALEVSDDGVSQAANSLVELIDWLLRSAFEDDEVLRWLDQTGLENEWYTDPQSGKQRPTKKGQALCFVHGGADLKPDGHTELHEAVAIAIVTARRGLQKLKHADTGDDTEKVLVAQYHHAVEGFLTVAIRLTWAALPQEDIDRLRTRLAA